MARAVLGCRAVMAGKQKNKKKPNRTADAAAESVERNKPAGGAAGPTTEPLMPFEARSAAGDNAAAARLAKAALADSSVDEATRVRAQALLDRINLQPKQAILWSVIMVALLIVFYRGIVHRNHELATLPMLPDPGKVIIQPQYQEPAPVPAEAPVAAPQPSDSAPTPNADTPGAGPALDAVPAGSSTPNADTPGAGAGATPAPPADRAGQESPHGAP